jgi:hypothetical protein
MHTPNLNHIKGIRDAAYAALDEFARANRLDSVEAIDAVIGLTYAIATIIKDAPDSDVRFRMQRAVMQAVTGQSIDGAPGSRIIAPKSSLVM